MLYRLLLALALATGASSAAQAQSAQQVLTGCGTAAPPLGPGAPAFASAMGSHCVDTVNQGAAVYRGNTIAANAAQTFLAANPNRRGWSFQNQTTGNCGLKVGGAAATLDQLSLRIAPGALYETPSQHVSTGAVSVICASAGGYYGTEY